MVWCTSIIAKLYPGYGLAMISYAKPKPGNSLTIYACQTIQFGRGNGFVCYTVHVFLNSVTDYASINGTLGSLSN